MKAYDVTCREEGYSSGETLAGLIAIIGNAALAQAVLEKGHVSDVFAVTWAWGVAVMLGIATSANVSGNQSIDHYLSVHKDSFSNPPTNRRIEEAVVGDWRKMMKFEAS
ncbi:hypothetical protein AVEN_240997-1 [Araneus ventricosus]|uniref:Uncharacterized protein n=1 Tax=Araneus ventricosus TaxID=182803 RepID=A0A4Y2N9P1_ARAVE|nr:hypothetical protein AVEN_240997-1 [Araneus ventricosus]